MSTATAELPATTPAISRRGAIIRRLGEALAVLGCLFGIATWIQYDAGAFQSEFGSHPDEAAHVVTGLMAYDYLTSADWSDPIGYAENYYLHYPKVAIGHWPPVFYLAQSMWMLVFGDGRTSLVLLMAFFSALLGGLVYAAVRRSSGVAAAIPAAVGFLSLPIVRSSTVGVMTEMPLAFFAAAATAAFAEYVRLNGSRRHLIAFVCFASLAVLTKGSSLFLALVPGACLVLSRRSDLLRRRALWVAAAVVALLCGPFYLWSLRMQLNGMAHESFSVDFVSRAATFFPVVLLHELTPLVALSGLIGFGQRVISPLARGTAPTPEDAAAGGLLLSVVLFHILVPAGLEPRHLIPACAPAVVFAALGVEWICRGILNFGASQGFRFAATAAVFVAVVVVGRPIRKEWSGFRPVVEHLSAPYYGNVSMVSSDTQGEGMMIAETSLHDVRRPERYALRASKILATDRWSGADYQAKFPSSNDVLQFLDRTPITALVLDTSVPANQQTLHHRQLIEMAAAHPDDWEPDRRFDLVRNGKTFPEAIVVYRRRSPPVGSMDDLEIDLKPMLGRSLRLGSSQVDVRNKRVPSRVP